MTESGAFCGRCLGAKKVFVAAIVDGSSRFVFVACPGCQPGPHPQPSVPQRP